VLNEITFGMKVVLRSGAMPMLLGLRWAQRQFEGDLQGIPVPTGGLKLASKVALDELFLATELASATFVSLRDHRRVGREIDEAVSLYQRRGWLYHLSPLPLRVAQLKHLSSAWGRYQHLSFESGYEPHPEEPGRDRWLSHRENHTAHAWLFQHRGEPRPWLVCVPGYRMGTPAVDFTGFRARWLHDKLGLNVAIPVMPLHGPRRVGRRGGDGFLSGDFIDTIHAQAQAAWDVRRLVAWLRSKESPAVGVYGVSLGGYTTALLAGLEENLDCVIAGIPATDFLRLLQRHAPSFLMRAAERFHFPFEKIEQMLRVVSPLAIAPRVPHERRYLYAGIADRLASPDHARDLWQHWERPRLAWYEGGHVSFLWEARVEALIREALHKCGLISSVTPG
jgi:hypothetical protein